MATFSPGDIRNICLVGHGDAGKTTLADWLLAATGAVQRQGNIKEKTSIFDFDDLEKDKQHTIESAVARCEHDGKVLNVIDTPGYPDFVGDAIGGLVAADSAVVCVSAVGAVQVNTRRTMEVAESLDRARMIVITKCDHQEADLDKVMASVREWFGDRCVPVNMTEGFGAKLTGIVDVMGATEGDAKAYYDAFVEAAVEADDDAMTKYLEGEELSQDELDALLPKAVTSGTVIPVVFTSAEKELGMDQFLATITRLLPGADVISRSYGDGDAPMTADGPFIGHVFKITIDKHVGKVSYVRAVSGTLNPGDNFQIVDGSRKERVGHIMTPFGKDMNQVESASVGEIVTLTKLDALKISQTMTTGDGDDKLASLPLPRPMAQLAVRPASRADETKISEALTKLSDEIPTFETHREASTRELIASASSQLQLDVAFRRLKDRYGIEVETSPARVPYRECVTVEAKGHYRHKKQSGGRGQFGEVYLTVSPGEAGSGLTFEWNVVGGSIPTNFGPAIEKGVREKMGLGVIAGYQIEDIKVSVTDGKFHDVDSSEAAFKIAGGRAFAEAVSNARPVLLEPMVEAEIVVPSASMGDISADLNTRRGRIMGMEAKGPFQVIQAAAPKSEMAEYARILTSLTSGEGSFTYEETEYEQVPANVQADIVAQFKPQDDDD